MNAALPNWDVIAFDCDGVLLDSNGMKSAAFRATLASAGVAADTAEAFCEHQVRHFGTSRHRLFTDLLAGRFGACPDGLTLEALLQAFGQASRDGYRRVTPTRGAEALLQALSGRMLYVASGSDERELRQEFDARGWSPHFRAVLGSPRPKVDLLGEVVRDELRRAATVPTPSQRKTPAPRQCPWTGTRPSPKFRSGCTG